MREPIRSGGGCGEEAEVVVVNLVAFDEADGPPDESICNARRNGEEKAQVFVTQGGSISH